MATKHDHYQAKRLQARVNRLTRAMERMRQQLERSRQNESALLRNEQRLRSVFNGVSIGLAEITADGTFSEANSVFCRLLGYRHEELLALAYLDILDPEDREADRNIMMQLLDGKLPSFHGEKRYVRNDGKIIWVDLDLAVAPREGGHQTCLLATIEDITERKTTQESLSRIASNLAEAERMALSGTWRWDNRTGETTASEDTFRLFGLKPTQQPVPIEYFLDRILAEDRPPVERAIESLFSGNRGYQVEYRIVLPDGKQKLIHASGEVLSRGEHGQPHVIIGVVQDIGLRRKAERALEDSEQRFRTLFEHASDGIIIANRDGVYTDANRSACTMLGYTHEELKGRRIVDLISSSEADRFAKSMSYLQQDLSHSEVTEWELKRKDGTFLPVELSTRMLPDGRWMASVRDISERRRAHQAIARYAEEVRDLYDNAPCGYHSLDRDGVIVQINQTELDWLGYTREELVGRKNVTDLLTEQSQAKFREGYPEFLRRGRVHDVEFEFLRKDGTILPVLVSAAGIFDAQGNVLSSRTTLFDITEMREARAKLRQAAAVFEHTNEAILITDADNTIVAVNKAFTRITGYTPEDVIGKNPRLLKSGRQDEAFYRHLWNAIEEHGFWQGEIWDTKKSGEMFPAWESITAVKDESGKVTEHISVFSDITTIKETEEKLTRLAYQDALTGLPNRLLYNDRLSQALAYARRHALRGALLMLDLDRFKLVNDTLGHSAGDELLQAIAARLNTSGRAENTIARLGGDEFAIILPQVAEPADAALMAEKVVHLVSQPMKIAGQEITISASVGIAIFPDDAEDAETLAKVADTAMYGAKNKGRNAYEFYRPEMTTAASELLAIDRGLRNAIQSNQLVVLYQPKIELSTGRIAGVEALVRWHPPSQGMRSPDSFIHVAEETSLIDRIGDWIFDAVCNQIREWKDRQVPPVRIAVNVSARQFRNPHYVENIRKKLAACSPFDGFGVDVEVTETTLQSEPSIAEALRQLKAIGFTIAIDDFGTGYSSLSSLKQLPVDTLKIDRSFIEEIPDGPDSTAIASAIIAMGHSLGLTVVAEGVETQEQLKFVVDQGCDEAQGFLFFSPLSAQECEQFLMKGSVEPMLLQVLGKSHEHQWRQ
ncbi:PAS domain S-box protein [Noviherbaspirillum denitrificans]|uniref:Diguanylate cyclase n=1 Tax=Noviherbaspirillum denitrificans TaxID=1968433 RepID=A0A254TET6_9BURK|nr:PAS domain S-box protein [Noviherbaspirillum denitrificans]OWW21151.1 hypothetical protein AYR66_18400 [Noviherbaspirillum denitrificans]